MIFILGCHKSGTSLMRSLLDGHTQLSVLPYETHFFEALGMNSLNPIRRNFGRRSQSHKDMIETLENHLNAANRNSDTRADVKLSEKIQAKFSDIQADLSVKEKFVQFAGKLTAKNPQIIVEKSVENFELAAYIKLMIPEAKFIQIVRNPYANLVALRKFKTRNKYPPLSDLLMTIKLAFHYAFQNQSFLSDYTVLKYEDLLMKPRAKLKEISNFLGVGFEEVMMKPTLMGRKWEGNSTEKKPLNNLDLSRINAWKSDICPLESHLVSKFFDKALDGFGYERHEIRGFYKMNNHETLKTYLRNRFISLYDDVF